MIGLIKSQFKVDLIGADGPRPLQLSHLVKRKQFLRSGIRYEFAEYRHRRAGYSFIVSYTQSHAVVQHFDRMVEIAIRRPCTFAHGSGGVTVSTNSASIHAVNWHLLPSACGPINRIRFVEPDKCQCLDNFVL